MYAHAAAALGLRYLPMLHGVAPNMFLSAGENLREMPDPLCDALASFAFTNCYRGARAGGTAPPARDRRAAGAGVRWRQLAVSCGGFL